MSQSFNMQVRTQSPEMTMCRCMLRIEGVKLVSIFILMIYRPTPIIFPSVTNGVLFLNDDAVFSQNRTVSSAWQDLIRNSPSIVGGTVGVIKTHSPPLLRAHVTKKKLSPRDGESESSKLYAAARFLPLAACRPGVYKLSLPGPPNSRPGGAVSH